MAIYALEIKHKAKGQGASASAHALYIAREGKYAGKGAESHAEYLAREGKHGRRAHELEATWSGNMPKWAEKPREFWEAADTYERANGRVYTEIVVALPRELSFEQRRELVGSFVGQEIGDRFPYTVAMHNPKALDGGQQPHAHIMFSIREDDGIAREKAQFFKRANEKNPEKGGAKKSRDWSRDSQANDRVNEIRKSWEELANGALERAGYEVRIDRRTLEAQGIEREPEPKMGPVVTQKLKRGEETEIGGRVIELREYREKAKRLEKVEKKLAEERGKLLEFPGERTQERSEFRNGGPKRKVSEEEARQYRRTVDLVLTRFQRQDGATEFRWKKSGTVAFVDKGDSIEFRSTNQTAIKAALQVAKEKGWQAVDVSGSDQFRRDAWLEAQLMGFGVSGYEATAQDRATLEQMRSEQTKKREQYEPQSRAGQKEKKDMPNDDVSRGQEAGQSRGPSEWVKASEVLKSYEKGRTEVEKEIQEINKERKKLGLDNSDWVEKYPAGLSEKEALERAKFDYDGGRLRKIWEEAQKRDRDYLIAEKAFQEFKKSEEQLGPIQRLRPKHRREGKELYAAAEGVRKGYNQSAGAYDQLLKEYEKPEHKTRIEADAKNLLEQDKTTQLERGKVEKRLADKKAQSDEFHKAIFPLRALGEREIKAERTKNGDYRVEDFHEVLKRVKEIEQQRRQSMQKSKGMER